MSTELKSNLENFNLTRFYGGKERGVCLQLSQREFKETPRASGYVQLTREEAMKLALQLLEFAAAPMEMETDE